MRIVVLGDGETWMEMQDAAIIDVEGEFESDDVKCIYDAAVFGEDLPEELSHLEIKRAKFVELVYDTYLKSKEILRVSR